VREEKSTHSLIYAHYTYVCTGNDCRVSKDGPAKKQVFCAASNLAQRSPFAMTFICTLVTIIIANATTVVCVVVV